MRARTVTTVLAALALTSSLAFAVSARADTTTQPTQSFTTAGTYYVTVPDRIDGFELDGVGGAGYAGDPGSLASGGAGGSGTHVHGTFGDVVFFPGDVLKVVVGAKGGGGQRGYGSELSGSGGNGGGATTITNTRSGDVLLVAGGGGGGGGGSSLGIGFTGGRGGTAGNGTPGIGTGGDDAGRGGAAGQVGDCTQGVGQGGTGESAPTASAVAGGGGGGQGACGGGGQSGGSGEHGAGKGGGGGGGAGASYIAPFASGVQYSAGTNTGDGSASITFTTTNTVQPMITTPNCMYLANPSPSTYVYVSATGDPLPTLKLLGGPSWLLDEGSMPYFNFVEVGSVLTLQVNGAVAPGQYRAQVEAMNEAGSVVEPLTLVAGRDQPAFLSPDTATATAGSPFTFGVQAVECPPIQYYSITSGQNDVPWLTIDRETGELSGTPDASDVGTHMITVQAATGGVAGTTLTQTLTVRVDPAAVTPPPVTIPPVTGTPPAPPTNPAPPAGTQPPAPPVASSGSTPPGSSPAGPAPKPPATTKPTADLSVHLSGPTKVRAGRTFTETLTVTNHGPHRAGRVHLALRVPHGFAASNAAGASRHGRALRWHITTLPAHATRTYTLTLRVTAHRHGHRTITAAVRSLAAHDPNDHNNHRADRLRIVRTQPKTSARFDPGVRIGSVKSG